MVKKHKPKLPCDKKKSRCCIGCVECSPENEGSNNAAIVQNLSQTTVTVFLCGADDRSSPFQMSLASDSDEIESETQDTQDTEDAPGENKTFADALIAFIQKKIQEKNAKT
jgi:hypothetical protein